jgi:hypothetical protein
MDLKDINAEKIKELIQDKKVRAAVAVGSLVLMVLIWTVVWLTSGPSNNQDKNTVRPAVTVLPEKLNFEIEQPNKFVENMALFKSMDIFKPFGGPESSFSTTTTGSFDDTTGYSTESGGQDKVPWSGTPVATSKPKPPINKTPKITSDPNLTAAVGSPYTYDVNADGDLITFSLTKSPSGMTVDSKTGVIGWTPISSQKGDNSVTVRATDSKGAYVEQAFTVTVSGSNPKTTIYLKSIFESGGKYWARISINGGSYQNFSEGNTLAQYFNLVDVDNASQSVVFLYGDEREVLEVGKTLSKEIND